MTLNITIKFDKVWHIVNNYTDRSEWLEFFCDEHLEFRLFVSPESGWILEDFRGKPSTLYLGTDVVKAKECLDELKGATSIKDSGIRSRTLTSVERFWTSSLELLI